MKGIDVAFTVKVRYLAVLRGLSEEAEKNVRLEGGSLVDLLTWLRSRESETLKSRLFGEGGKMRPDVLVFINNVDASLLGGIAAELKEGDCVTFLPSVHGG